LPFPYCLREGTGKGKELSREGEPKEDYLRIRRQCQGVEAKKKDPLRNPFTKHEKN
jgi:hypothetical protein